MPLTRWDHTSFDQVGTNVSLSPEKLDELRQIGKQRRRRERAQDRKRRELAPYLDVGMMSDDDINEAYAAYRSGLDDPTIIIPTAN